MKGRARTITVDDPVDHLAATLHLEGGPCNPTAVNDRIRDEVRARHDAHRNEIQGIRRLNVLLEKIQSQAARQFPEE